MTSRNNYKENTMSKSSKSCSYTGHMHVMNRVNQTKEAYASNHAQSQGLHNNVKQEHLKHKAVYPEVQAQANAQAKCSCKK